MAKKYEEGGGSALPPLPPHAFIAPQFPLCGKITDILLLRKIIL